MRLSPTLLLLAACAAPAPQWVKPGASQAAVHEALQECRVRGSLSPQQHKGTPAARSSSAPGLDRIDERRAYEAQQLEQCMRDGGFSAKR